MLTPHTHPDAPAVKIEPHRVVAHRGADGWWWGVEWENLRHTGKAATLPEVFAAMAAAIEARTQEPRS